MSYQVKLSPRARRELSRFRGDTFLRLKSAIDELANDPRPPGCLKMEDRLNEWRIRVGVYRVLYDIDDAERQVRIRRLGHRREIYDH